uniref:Reverse transcriptase domain-containing protein n=1 Tax=Tanacetum cinerariifolium TaxID=118510 RepID=A0A6L2KCB9_TANCI|nr:hypothetical protein [Tanacetum cinerariifolium]
MQKHGATGWLVNTGWSGGSYGSGVPSEILDPANSWADKGAHKETLTKLGGLFKKNFEGLSRPSGLGGVDGCRETRRYDRLAGTRRIRVGCWNVGSLSRKFLELGDALGRHKVDIACFQETKWKGFRAREGNGYKLCDRIMEITVIIEGETVNVISAYAPNEEGRTILEFATAYDLVVANSFKKSDPHLITFQSGGHSTQIDYLLAEATLEHARTAGPSQARLAHLYTDWILWKNLKGVAVETFRATVFEKLSALEDMSAGNADRMWNTLAGAIKDATKDFLGVASESTRTHSTHRESWWFCEEVQSKVAAKQSRFKDLLSCREGNQEDMALAKERDEDIRNRWGEYSLFNGSPSNESRPERSGEVVCSSPHMHYDCYYSKINQGEVRAALQKMGKMGRNKAVGPDQIPIEAWRCLEDEGVKWLTCLFNKIFSSSKMPEEWRLSKVIPIYKNKGDAQACSNYRGIKLLSHTMKLWERVIERRLRRETRVSENQFSFMPGRSTTEAIHLLRSLMEKYWERQRDLHMAFLDLEKAYDSVPRDLVWKTLIDKGTPRRYLSHKGYVRGGEDLRTDHGKEHKVFPGRSRSSSGSAISSYLFTLILDELSRGTQENIPWCMIFADDIVLDDIVLIAESAEGLNNGLRVSREKTEYLRCEFGRYLGSVIHRSGRIDEDVAHRIRAGWMKWRAASGVLCDRRIHLKLKGKFYKVAIRPAMLYSSECWPITKAQANRVEVAELRMLRWTCGRTFVDMIPNGVFRAVLEVDSIIDKMREERLRWFGHVNRRPQTAPVRRVEALVDGARRRGRPKLG